MKKSMRFLGVAPAVLRLVGVDPRGVGGLPTRTKHQLRTSVADWTADAKMEDGAPCMWCEQASKTCRSCGRKICPKHCNRANGCCVPCLDAIQDAVRAGRCTDQQEEEEIERQEGIAEGAVDEEGDGEGE